MRLHYYVFGSICRGELDTFSDVDLLACVSGAHLEVSRDKFSIYQHSRMEELWREGNPFAWHLFLESKMVYASDNKDFIKSLGKPNKYINFDKDFQKFKHLFFTALKETKLDGTNATFNISCMFLAIRNIATCYSLWKQRANFSRNSAILIDKPLNIHEKIFEVFIRARILSTRGVGENLSPENIQEVLSSELIICNWIEQLGGNLK
jgi:predicted nucleotidyltransferase